MSDLDTVLNSEKNASSRMWEKWMRKRLGVRSAPWFSWLPGLFGTALGKREGRAQIGSLGCPRDRSSVSLITVHQAPTLMCSSK